MADPVPAARRPAARPPLVGRDRELAALRACLAAALAGEGGLVLLGGEAGIGKTALAEAVGREAAARGALVLVGRCYDLSETPPYGPWLDAFARYPRDPALPPLPAPLAERGRLGPVASREALFAQVRDFLAAAAATCPLVLLLDDLHWADPASLDLLRVLARGLADLPLLLLATYRSDELPEHHPLAALLPRLMREAAAERLDLRPLDEPAVRALVAARYALAEPDLGRLVACLQEHAEGNPFYLGELLRALEGGALRLAADGAWALGDLSTAPVPPLLRQIIAERAARLGGEAARLLALAAVIGQEAPLDLWRDVAGVDEAALLELVERAAEARLLTPTPEGAGVRFAHALTREVLYAGILPPRRRALHRRVAEALAAQPGPDPDAVAYQFRQAGDARALVWLLEAGHRAQRAYAWLTAAARYTAALTLMGEADPAARGWLLLRLAQVRFYEDPRGGIGHLEEVARLAAAAGDRALAAYARNRLGFQRSGLGDYRRGLAEMAAGVAALEALPRAGRARLAAVGDDEVEDARATLAARLALAGRYAEARAQAARVLVTRALARAPTVGNAHAALGEVHAAAGRAGPARRAFARASAAWRAHGAAHSDAVYALIALFKAVLPYQADDLVARQRLAAEAARAFARADAMQAATPPRLGHLPLLWLEGQWEEARALALWLRATRRTYRGFAATILGPLARAQGDGALAWALVREWLPAGPAAAPGGANYDNAVEMQRLAAALALDAGDLPTARAWLAAHDRWLAWSGTVRGRAEGALGWAAYHRAAGDLARAWRNAEAALAHAAAPRQPLALLAAHRLLGELATAAGEAADAERRLAEALALADACAAPYERALTLLALAELRAAAGRPGDADTPLAEARAILRPLEARPALARADALAARLAAAPAPAPAARPFGLTAREAEVLRLLAEGLPDAAIAARLFVSRHTVNAHTKAIYAKLGVASRAAAGHLAREHGLA
ncbi:MAG TPA: AAA family ATPase [Thermomicrobiales bacterium]|nr:AAA family ATPase [Thermomicrobiales bacterium]